MEFSPSKKPVLHGLGSKAQTPQRLKGGCKQSLGEVLTHGLHSNSANKSISNTHLNNFNAKRRLSSVSVSSSSILTDENCIPTKSPKIALPLSRGHNILKASHNNKAVEPKIWVLSKSENKNSNNLPSNSSIFSDDDSLSLSNFNNKPLKTYSKYCTPGKSTSTNSLSCPSKVTTINRKECNAANLNFYSSVLPLHSSVTVTQIPSPTPSSSVAKPVPAHSIRRLTFDTNAPNNVDTSSDYEDTEIFPLNSTKKRKRNPLAPIRPKFVSKSSILCDVSPTKIEKAYGPGSSPSSEKENVPIIREVEKPISPHLLGFPNLGNTCYLNAVLQALVGVRVFRCDVSACIQLLPAAAPQTSILYALMELLSARRAGHPSGLKQPLRSIKENFEKLDSSFIGWKMQDANEFLTKVLDTVKDEVEQILANYDSNNKQGTDCSNKITNESKSDNEDWKSSLLSNFQWSPFKSNIPKLLNNSVEIRSITPTNDNCSNSSQCHSAAGQDVQVTSVCNNKSQTNWSRLAFAVKQKNRVNVENNKLVSSSDNTEQCSVVLTNGTNMPSDSDDQSECSKNIDRSITSQRVLNSSETVENRLAETPSCNKSLGVNIRKRNRSSSPASAKSQKTRPSEQDEVTSVVNPITANFGFQLHEVYQCLGCGACVQRPQDYFSLYVHLSPCGDNDGPSSIREAVAAYMKQEQREIKCEACGHPAAEVLTRFTKMPRILIIQVKRYKFNAAQYSSLKVCSNIGVSKSLDLSPYCESDASPYLAVPGKPARSAPPTPFKAQPPAASDSLFKINACSKGAKLTRSLSSSSIPLAVERQPKGSDDDQLPDLDAVASTDDGAAQDKNTKENALTEDEQFQEALRRSLEDTCSGSTTQAGEEEEEDDLQRAIRLSLMEAEQRLQQEAEQQQHLQEDENRGSDERADTSLLEEEEEECSGPHCYQLASIVSHFGRNTTAGHYTCDVLSEACPAWLHYDDETVTEVPRTTVLGESRQRNGYIFFYVHRDLLPASVC